MRSSFYLYRALPTHVDHPAMHPPPTNPCSPSVARRRPPAYPRATQPALRRQLRHPPQWPQSHSVKQLTMLANATRLARVQSEARWGSLRGVEARTGPGFGTGHGCVVALLPARCACITTSAVAAGASGARGRGRRVARFLAKRLAVVGGRVDGRRVHGFGVQGRGLVVRGRRIARSRAVGLDGWAVVDGAHRN